MPPARAVYARIVALVFLIVVFASSIGVVHAESAALTSSQIEARGAIVMDAKSGKALYEKNADTRMYPASTTKILTLLIALEYGHLDDQIEIPPEAANIPRDSSLIPVQIGERMIFRDLLYGFFLNSGNDGANAIAVIVAGSVENFATLMNEKAASIGCKDFNFVNPHGYHDDNHYCTPRDMALIAREAMKNDSFRAIAATDTYTMAKTNKREAYTITNGNQMVVPGSEHYMKTMTGIKTGYHSKAGQCFVGSALKGSKELITVAFNSSKVGKWTDTKRMLEYGFSLYEEYTFGELYSLSPIYVTIGGSHDDDVGGGVLLLTPVPGETDDFGALCLPDELGETVIDFASRMSVDYSRDLKAPVLAGDIIGTLTFTPENSEPLHTTLIASRDIQAAPEPFDIADYVPALKSINMEMIRFIGVVAGLIIVLIVYVKIRGALRMRRRRKAIEKRRRRALER